MRKQINVVGIDKLNLIKRYPIKLSENSSENTKAFYKGYRILLELDIVEAIDKANFSLRGKKYEKDKNFLDRRYQRCLDIFEAFEQVDFSKSAKDLFFLVAPHIISDLLQDLMDFFVGIEYYEECAKLRDWLLEVDKNKELLNSNVTLCYDILAD